MLLSKGLEVMKTYTIFMSTFDMVSEAEMIAESVSSILGIVLDTLQNILWCKG